MPAILSACVLALQAKSEFLSHMSHIAKPVSVKDIENVLTEIEDQQKTGLKGANVHFLGPVL